jgi:hypothetical protein
MAVHDNLSPLPTPDQIDELVAFLPKLYAEGFEAIERMVSNNPDGSLIFPYAVYSDVVDEFVEVASQEHWCDFSYSPATSGDGLEDPAFVARASLDEVKTMLTWSIRGERFCSGHWGHVIESGKVRLLLKRLAVIRQELGQSRSTE